jgi:hypothetical protein
MENLPQPPPWQKLGLVVNIGASALWMHRYGPTCTQPLT